MIDIYSKAAIAAITNIATPSGYAILLTSSNEATSCAESGEKLAAAISALDRNAKFTDLAQNDISSPEAAKKAIAAACEDCDVAVISALPARTSQSAMLLAAAAKNVILLEKQNLSRTDYIDDTIATLASINVAPVGFILL